MTPYIAFWVPEHLGGSGVLATVGTGLFVSWNGPLLRWLLRERRRRDSCESLSYRVAMRRKSLSRQNMTSPMCKASDRGRRKFEMCAKAKRLRLGCVSFSKFSNFARAYGDHASWFPPLGNANTQISSRQDLRNTAQFAFSRKELVMCFDAIADE